MLGVGFTDTEVDSEAGLLTRRILSPAVAGGVDATQAAPVIWSSPLVSRATALSPATLVQAATPGVGMATVKRLVESKQTSSSMASVVRSMFHAFSNKGLVSQLGSGNSVAGSSDAWTRGQWCCHQIRLGHL